MQTNLRCLDGTKGCAVMLNITGTMTKVDADQSGLFFILSKIRF